MRWPSAVAALAAVSILACKVGVDSDLPLPYACDPSSSLGDAQCAAGWRCATDGICRDPAVGAPTPCQGSADCLGGWHCGPGQVCYDRATAGAIPCRPELEADGGSDCAAGWRCPSGGICQQRGVFGAYPCETTADCEGGGHCGLIGRCYLRETAGGVPCRQELDGDPDLRDCGPQWVCSGNGRCVDARSWDLRGNGPLSELGVSAVGAGGGGAVDHIATECYRPSAGTCGNTFALTLARGSALELHRIPASGPVDPPITVQLPGSIQALATTTVPGAALQAYSLVATAGGVSHVSWPPAGAPVTTSLVLPFVPDQVLAPSAVPYFVALRGADLVLVSRDGMQVSAPQRLPAGQGGGALSYGDVSVFGVAPDYWMTAISGEGMFASRLTGTGLFILGDGGTQALPDWTPVRVPGTTHAACPGDDGGVGTLIKVSSTGSGSSGSGSFRVVRIALVPGEGPLTGRASSYQVTFRVDQQPVPCGLPGTFVSSTCPLCPSGSALAGLHARTATALCELPLGDGGVSAGPVSLSGCNAEPAFGGRPLGTARLTAVDTGDTSGWSYGASDGQAIQIGASSQPVPLRLNRPPSYLAPGPGDAGVAFAGALAYAQAGAGFELCEILANSQCTAVRGAEAWRFTTQFTAVSFTGPTASGSLEDSQGVSCTEEVPLLAEAVALPDGGAGLIVTGKDRLWANTLPPEAGSPWPVRIAPAPFAAITSLAALRPSSVDPAAWGSAYVIANDQVFSVRAQSLNRWSATALPGAAGEPFRAWADPERGRVTYRDGTTYSLPLFAKIAGPAPGISPQVRDVAEICGAAFIASGGALLRLEQDGTWQPVPMPASVGSRTWTKLITWGETLYAFADDGFAINVSDRACARP